MNTTAILSPRQFRAPVAGSVPYRDGGLFAQPSRSVLDAGDFGAVAFTFAFVTGLILSGALVGVAYLLSVILRGVGSIDDVAGFQLARDLLPWACAFTATTACIALFGLKAAKLLINRVPETSPVGFGKP